MRIFLASFMLTAVLCGAAALDMSPTGCTPAQDAVFVQVENVILKNLVDHKTLEAIEAAVAVLVPAGTDVDLAITAAIDYLHSIGALPPDILPTSLSVQMAIASKAHFVKGLQ